MAKAGGKPRKKANGYTLPDPLPSGLILEDIAKKKWKLGVAIGKGGFGEIYSAQEVGDGLKRNSEYPYVIKIEPHENGPLFVEMHFYMRHAKPNDIDAFMKEKKMLSFGMPKYLGSGSYEHKNKKYRFIVMHKFGTDIWKLFLENNKCFPTETVFKLGIQIFDVLEYIHSKGYIHGDIKGANILMGIGKEAQTQVYLVDFGLTSHYDTTYKPNPKNAHNGTIEYLSRDAHNGVKSRRGDLEILGYNLAHWLGGTLPWEDNLSDPVVVQMNKEKYMSSLPEFFKVCIGNRQPPAALVDYFKYVISLKFETDPDYKKLRKILLSGLETAGGSIRSPLKFKSTTPKRKSATDTPTPKKKTKLTKEVEVEDDDVSETITPVKKKVVRKPKITKAQQNEQDNVDIESTSGYTAEMLRVKNQLDAKKKKAVKTQKVLSTSDRVLRKVKNVSYNDNGDSTNNVLNSDEDEKSTPEKSNRKKWK